MRNQKHPGEVLKELMGMQTVQDLSTRTGIYPTYLQSIINQEQQVSKELCKILDQVFDTSEDFWLNLQQRYEDFMGREKFEIAGEILDRGVSLPFVVIRNIETNKKHKIILGAPSVLLSKGVTVNEKFEVILEGLEQVYLINQDPYILFNGNLRKPDLNGFEFFKRG